MRAAVNYTAGKYACFCLKIHQECSEECVAAVVVVFAERQGIAPLHFPLLATTAPPHPSLPPSLPLSSSAGKIHPALSLSKLSGGKKKKKSTLCTSNAAFRWRGTREEFSGFAYECAADYYMKLSDNYLEYLSWHFTFLLAHFIYSLNF